jgi:hypothetical protein
MATLGVFQYGLRMRIALADLAWLMGLPLGGEWVCALIVCYCVPRPGGGVR